MWLVDEEGSYKFRPYSFTSRGILPIALYSPKSGAEPRSLRARSLLPKDLKILLVVLAPSPLKSESGEGLTTYSPQRLLRQFGFDQVTVLVTGSTCIDVWEAESRYLGGGRGALRGDFDSIFWPCKSREGVHSAGWALYWLRCLEVFT